MHTFLLFDLQEGQYAGAFKPAKQLLQNTWLQHVVVTARVARSRQMGQVNDSSISPIPSCSAVCEVCVFF